jgi:uncharacterized repeat protein (TIGR04076 family)
MPDDIFELYDLRVEVVCPEGEKILCGAKKGDYFTLEGEMMYLPPGQGISIYSLGWSNPRPPGRKCHVRWVTSSNPDLQLLCFLYSPPSRE